ncbi:MAG: endonuclease III [Nitrososphaerota archaeon]|nr:endonuclease III [Candidatus Bathyarchaeota archaeon]MCX8161801.1 endonuclease III [Candidatus Bathyarchaeota archaeon]MDW8062155.1 endonuclease III [Nitrososphaerota archaeon]
MPTDREYAYRVLERLRKAFPDTRIDLECNPFRGLILAILSQNTRDAYAYTAYKNLERMIGLSVEDIVRASEEAIAEAIKPAGLQREKARRIREAAKFIAKMGGSMEAILDLPLDEARAKLMEIEGVGEKTADVMLLFYGGKPTIPVDTHIRRVSARLGLVDKGVGYKKIRRGLESLYRSEDYMDVHLLLIALGRSFCKSRKPICGLCPVGDICPSKV